MGSRQHNFYREAFQRAGFADACEEIASLWAEGKRDEATARVPDELVIGTTLIGDDTEVADRVKAYQAAGITTLRLQPAGETVTERLDTLARALDVVRAAAA
jgi:alkanesulfonate monooxygenase SsuD/methylene tetrahydromethanopterin reductase-like flavin-dependent oxidoreductase (luciferase family)